MKTLLEPWNMVMRHPLPKCFTLRKFLSVAGFTFLASVVPVNAQQSDLMIVFDGSGSMWGQIEGRAKIEIARDTLSSVLSETVQDMNIGMIAYGHREKGQCSDIETVVPMGSAGQTVPQMIAVANALKPKGKTPLTDAVRKAAEELKYTENAATVVLVTDGIETCDADPCALANELESAGVDFTAHVVGFGLSQEEGRQVACLAENTGGLFLAADNADQLSDALSQTLAVQPIAPSEDDFADAGPVPRGAQFRFRDAEGTPLLDARSMEVIFESPDGLVPVEGSTGLAYTENNDYGAYGTFPLGRYTAVVTRNGAGGYTARHDFEIVEGEGVQSVEAVLGGFLTVNVFVNPNEPYDYANKPVAAVKATAWAYLGLFPIVDGAVPEQPLIMQNTQTISQAVPPGRYLLRGTIDRTTTAEQIVVVNPGNPTEIDFSFDATRVYVDARQTDGTPVERQTTYWYDKAPSGRNHWRSGYGGSADNGVVEPFYLPTGEWAVNVGGEGYGARRSERIVNVPGDYAEIRLTVGEGEQISDDEKGFMASPAYTGCRAVLGVGHNACLVKQADLAADAGASTPTMADEPKAAEAPVATQDEGTRVQYSFSTGLPGAGQVIVSLPENSGGPARITLQDKWCGVAGCGPAELTTPSASFALLGESKFDGSQFGAQGYSFSVTSFGEDKELTISGDGASRIVLAHVKSGK